MSDPQEARARKLAVMSIPIDADIEEARQAMREGCFGSDFVAMAAERARKAWATVKREMRR